MESIQLHYYQSVTGGLSNQYWWQEPSLERRRVSRKCHMMTKKWCHLSRS